MKKIVLCLAVYLISFVSFSYAQALEEWQWAEHNLTFAAIDDMTIMKHNGSEFEAKNEDVSMYYRVSGFTADSYEGMGTQLGELAVDLGMSQDSEIDVIEQESMPGAYIQGKADGENVLLFAIGNEERDIMVVGFIVFKNGFKVTALKMARGIYLH